MNNLKNLINFRNILTITKKEIKGFLDNPASYIVLIVFVVLWQFMFFKDAFLVEEASLRSMYELFPWLMLILVPAITMGSIAKEKDDGTLELVLTHPVNGLEVILGKFFGSGLFVLAGLLFSLPVAVSFSRFSNFDWGAYAGQFIGSVLFALALISLGIFVSSLLKNQIAALLLTVGLGFIFLILGSDFFTLDVSLSIVPLLERLSLLTHLTAISRGVLDFRDVWYFVSFCLVFLSLAYLQLLHLKFGNQKKRYLSLQVTVFLFIGITVLTNVIGDRIPGRLDLTQDQLYTLSSSTKKTLSGLDDLVTITLYASSKLPAQYSPIMRETRDLLKDYVSSSKGNIVLKVVDPTADAQKTADAMAAGIQQVQFNVVGQEEFQVKQGFMGLQISYAGQNEVIPFIQDTSDLEYQLTSLIKKLTTKNKPSIAFLTGHKEKDLTSKYTLWQKELSSQFETSTYAIDEQKAEIGDNVSVLVVAGPSTAFRDFEKTAIQNFLDKNKSVMFLLDNYEVNLQTLQASEVSQSSDDYVSSEFGVTVNKDIVYDMRSNETIRFSNGVMNYFLPYPFWIRAQVKDQTPVTSKIQDVVFPWASSLSLNDEIIKSKNFDAKKLLITTPYAGVKSGKVSLMPNQDFSTSNLSEQLLAVSLASKDNKGRVIVVGDSDLLTDDHVGNSPQNLIFGANVVSWLSNADTLADLRVKTGLTRRLVFSGANQSIIVKNVNLGLAFGLPIIIGVLRFVKRRKLKTLVYEAKS